MEKWNEICTDLCNCRNRNVSESEYQKQVVLDLRLLGWKLYAHEIREQMTIEIGAANALRPDFVIYKDEKPQFVIELKKPQHVQKERERMQLFSYMKQLNLKIGLYIGENIQVFYFDAAKDENPRQAFHVTLKTNSEDGKIFVELFSRENYSQERLLEFCQERIEQFRQQELLIEELKYLTSENGRIWIYDMLRQKYEQEHAADWVEDLLQQIDIRVDLKQTPLQKVTIQQNSRPASLQQQSPTARRYFSLNGNGHFCKNELAFAVIKRFVNDHPEMNYWEFEQTIMPKAIERWEVIQSKKQFSTDSMKNKRWFEKELLKSRDGIEFAVSTQCGDSDTSRVKFQEVLRFALQQGYKIAEVL